ncbi:MAG TPA: DUF11 domain-containing protein, partial [Rudaea sp.]|nr:DUF11 domain-containing protein [Rudaea sp.]
ASGASVTITTTATINAAGAFDNAATVSATEPDPNLANNTDNTGNGGTAGASADVSIDKTLVTTGPYVAGQTLTYTLLVANAGPSTATNVQVTDTPTNLTITNVSGGGCSALPCTIASLASGASVTITTTATINAAGAFDNAATVSATEPDPNLANNTDNTGNGGTAGAPQLTVTKTASPTTFTVGVPASYDVTVTNTGNASTSAGITLADALPSGISLTSASGANWNCTGTTNLSCTFAGSLAPSASTTLTLNVAVAASAVNGNNTATASGGGDPTCPATARCSGTVTVGVTAPQLTTTKTGTLDNTVVAPSNQSNPGDTIAYTITVANSGTGTATAITIVDPLLPTLNCTIGASAVSLPTALAAGASLVCTGTYALTATDVSNGSVSNTATTSAGNVCNPTTAGSTCAASTSTPLAVVPVLSTTKTGVLDNTVVAPNNQSDPGDQIHYTITVANSGNGAATGVNLSDAKLPSLTCTIGGNPATLPTTIAAGATLTCTGTYTLTAGDISAGSVTNTVTVSGTNACPPGTGCTGTEITPLGQVPVLAVTKSATPTPFVVGQPASYTITVANNGTAATSAAITLSDTLPSGITLATASGTNWNCTGTSALNCTFNGTLAAGANTVLTLNVDVAASATTGNNSATASGGGDSTCPAAARCTGTVPVAITVPQLTVGKTATPNPFVVGQPASYAVTVTNSGSATTVGNIVVTDTLPTGISLASASGANWGCTGTGTLACTFTGTLAVSASTTLTLDVNVGASATSGTNTATASGGGDPSCPAAGHCSGTTTVNVTSPQLDVTKTATPTSFTVGQPASYAITVTNSGTAATIGNVTISDALPAGITYVSATGSNWSCTGAPNLSCTFASTLAAGTSTVLTLNVNVGASATSGTNTATATGGGDPTCPAAPHCSGTVIVGAGGPQLALTKTATPSAFVIGQPASYTITVRNNGTASTVGAILVSDSLPAGITLQTYTGSNWTCSGTTSLNCSFSGTLAPAASTALTLDVQVGNSTTSGNNTATASGGGDPNCPGAANCTGTVPVSVTQVSRSVTPTPLDARWMLALLSLLLVGVALRHRTLSEKD